MNYRVIALSLSALAVFSACSGGGGGTNGTASLPGPVVPQSAPTVQPAASPVAATVLNTASFATASRGAQSGFAVSNGFAVYDFDLDLTTPGTSACTAVCATFWPPMSPPAGVTLAVPFGTIARPDGSLQLAYNGHPLYTYAQDTAATTASGDGLNVSGGLWHLAQAAALTTVLSATPAPTAAPTVY